MQTHFNTILLFVVVFVADMETGSTHSSMMSGTDGLYVINNSTEVSDTEDDEEKEIELIKVGLLVIFLYTIRVSPNLA